MSYASLAANQWISRSNLNNAFGTGALFQRASFTINQQWVEKDELNTWAWIDTSNASYSVKASNQYITKTNITARTCIDFVPSGIYLGTTTMRFDVLITNGPLPAAGTLTITFNTDNGGNGSYDFVFSGGETGTINGAEFDTNAAVYPMINPGSGIVTDSTITSYSYSTADTNNCYTAVSVQCLNCV